MFTARFLPFFVRSFMSRSRLTGANHFALLHHKYERGADHDEGAHRGGLGQLKKGVTSARDMNTEGNRAGVF